MRRTLVMAACALLVSAAGASSHAVDGISVSAGKAGGGDDTDFVRLALQWNWQKKWAAGSGWFIGGYWEAGIGLWKGDSPAGGNKDVAEVGIASVLRLQQSAPAGTAPYIEAGLGFHLLSARRLHNGKDLGSDYHFGSHAGAGIRFGHKGAFDLGYRFQHFSNAGLKKPNPGINFHQIRLQYHF